MAPVAPQSTKRKPLRLKATDRLANPLAPRKVHRPDSAVTDTFLSTKADKHRIKHASFVSRITKPTSSAAATKNAKRRAAARQKKDAEDAGDAVMTAGLADALPDLTPQELSAGAAELAGRVRHRSLRSRPGALRKKERVVRGEMARFGVSLAQLSSAPAQPQAQAPAATTSTSTSTSSSSRFAALRGFISATLEQNPAFASRGTGANAAV